VQVVQKWYRLKSQQNNPLYSNTLNVRDVVRILVPQPDIIEESALIRWYGGGTEEMMSNDGR